MLLTVSDLIIIFINIHLQNNCDYMVNSVNIQKNSHSKKKNNY